MQKLYKSLNLLHYHLSPSSASLSSEFRLNDICGHTCPIAHLSTNNRKLWLFNIYMNFQQEDVFWLCKPRLPSCKFGQVLHSLNPSPLPHPLKVNGKDSEKNNNNETKTNKFFLSTLHFQLLLTPCGQFNQLIGRFHEVMGSAMFVQFCKCLFFEATTALRRHWSSLQRQSLCRRIWKWWAFQ